MMPAVRKRFFFKKSIPISADYFECLSKRNCSCYLPLPLPAMGAGKPISRPALIFSDPLQFDDAEQCRSIEALAKLLKAPYNRHSGQAKRDPESRIFKRISKSKTNKFRISLEF